MQVSVEEINSLTKKLKVVLPEDFVSKRLDKAYRDLQSEVSIKGFRKGKVPRKILEKNYGPKVQYDLSEKMIQDTYFDALGKSDLDVVVHPDLKDHKFEDDGSFSYEAEIDVRPSFEMSQHKGLEVELPEIVVSDEEVNAELENLRKEMAPLKNVDDRSIENNDLVVVDFQGYNNGEPMSQVVGTDYSVDIGSGNNGKEFEEACLGLNKGDETSREITFPVDFPNPVLAGKKVEFKISIKDIKQRILADLDDEFAKDVGEEFATLDDLKKHISDKQYKEKEEARYGDITDQVMHQLLEANTFEVPARLIQYEINHYISEIEENLKKRGLTLESAGMNLDTMTENYRETAEKRVRGDFILKKIAEIENIKLEDEDISKGFARISEKYGMPVSEVKKYFQSREDLLPFMNELHTEKILEFMREQTVIKNVAAEEGQSADEKTGAGEEA